MAKVKSLIGDTEQFDYHFVGSEAVEVTDPGHLAKFRGNASFEVKGETAAADANQQIGKPSADLDKANARIEELEAEVEKLTKRDENGDTEEMAALRVKFSAAWADLTGKYDKAVADLAALQAQHALKAEHHGGGKFNITKGEDVLAKGLSKADADAFNALSDAEKAEYVQGLKAE